MIAIYADNFDRARFFLRLAKGLKTEVIFLTTKPSAYLYLKRFFKCYLITVNSGFTQASTDFPSDKVIDSFTHVYRGTQSSEQALRVYNAVFAFCSNIDESIECAFVFNGNSASQTAFVNAYKSKDVPIVFCEISNLPGKVLFDSAGVNAKSILYGQPQILDNLPSVSNSDHENWLNVYFDYKRNPIPQGKITAPLSLAYLLDAVSFSLGFGLREENVTLLKKISNSMLMVGTKKKQLLKSINFDLSKDYVFFPTQVRFDSQLIVNSDIDNEQAIEYASKLAMKHNMKLLVKIHPAEEDIEIIKSYYELQKKYAFEIVSNNTSELILHANHVVVINSTVGLEALLLHKEVTVLGRAIYSQFDYERVKKYIHHYLINFDYFSNEKISISEANKASSLFGLNLR